MNVATPDPERKPGDTDISENTAHGPAADLTSGPEPGAFDWIIEGYDDNQTCIPEPEIPARNGAAMLLFSPLDGALAALDRGVAVFPCVRLGKAPLTPNGFRDATRDLAQVYQWAKQEPGCNWGSPPDTTFVVDLDTKHGHDGPGSWAKLLAAHGQAPETYAVQTPSGGQHLYFDGVAPTSNGTIADGIDIRGEGKGYVLLEGSRVTNDDGSIGVYTRVGNAPVAAAPEWLVRVCRERAGDGSPEPDATVLGQLIAIIRDDRILDMGDLSPKVQARLTGRGLQERLDALDTRHAPWMSAAMALFNRGLTVREVAQVLAAHQEKGDWGDFDPARHIARAVLKGEALARRQETDAAEMLRKLKPEQEAGEHDDCMGHKLYRPAQWATAFKEPAMLVDGLVPDNALTAFGGYFGSGKTYAAADVSFSVAAGLPVFGTFKVNRTGPVVYMTAEGAAGLAHRRFAALAKVYTKGVIPPNLIIADGVVLLGEGAEQWIADIRAALGGESPVLVVNDTKARSMGGADSNAEGPTMLHYNQMEAIRKAFGCAVIDLMHNGKNEGAGFMGSIANYNAVDWTLSIEKPGDPLKPSLLIVAVLKIGKVKDDPSDADTTYLKAQAVSLGVNAAGKPVGSLVLRPIGKDAYKAEAAAINGKALAERPDVVAARGKAQAVLEALAMKPAAVAGDMNSWLSKDTLLARLTGDPEQFDGGVSGLAYNTAKSVWATFLKNNMAKGEVLETLHAPRSTTGRANEPHSWFGPESGVE